MNLVSLPLSHRLYPYVYPDKEFNATVLIRFLILFALAFNRLGNKLRNT